MKKILKKFEGFGFFEGTNSPENMYIVLLEWPCVQEPARFPILKQYHKIPFHRHSKMPPCLLQD